MVMDDSGSIPDRLRIRSTFSGLWDQHLKACHVAIRKTPTLILAMICQQTPIFNESLLHRIVLSLFLRFMSTNKRNNVVFSTIPSSVVLSVY
jgi:hypothetical protein